ncbi:MAG TPA: hypothetical protein VM432_12365 [Bdellovibrionales bacterium]|nr:hypothetical protein [Bdellovibrionales bacterium]
MKAFTLAVLVGSLTILSACSSSQKEQDQNAPAESTAEVPTQDFIMTKYSVQEFNSAVIGLKAALESPDANVLGCSITAQEAREMLVPLKGMLDRKISSESKDYADDPRVYAKNNGFETCGGNCQCGVLASVVERAPSVKASSDPKLHTRLLTKLQAKAKLQTPQQTLACAKNQSWFCSSELRAYLQNSKVENH